LYLAPMVRNQGTWRRRTRRRFWICCVGLRCQLKRKDNGLVLLPGCQRSLVTNVVSCGINSELCWSASQMYPRCVFVYVVSWIAVRSV